MAKTVNKEKKTSKKSANTQKQASSTKTSNKKVENKKNQKEKKSDSTQQSKKSLISNNDKLRINIPWSELKKPYQQTISDLAKKMKIEGFRKGKIPLNIAEKQVSLEKIAETILKDILPKKF